MIKNINRFLIFSLIISAKLWATNLQSPSQFLGYDLGDKFTFHHDAVDYFEHVSAVSNHIGIVKYGDTYEGRPLIASFISHPNNTQSLEAIRKNHLITSGIMDGDLPDKSLSVVWLSYSVHGNESSSMEAALKTLHTFADTSNKTQMKWLEKVILIIDPCINPDGRDRYANFHRRTGNVIPDIDAKTREHREPWHSGRTNHYSHDLNRDWAWQTQKESQDRIKLYNKWMPHVHVDYHEQSYNEPYYFAPAVEPYHELITPWQRKFQTMIGNNNAKYFDERQLLYFRNEDFDLLYPSYGDTYPTYKGAIGMTYEKAGSGSGGVAVKTLDSDTLTLKERLDHHYLTGLATVEATYQHSDKVIQEFQTYFKNANSKPQGNYKTYIIQRNLMNEVQIEHLLDFLDLNGIQYSGIKKSGSISIEKAYNYFTGKSENIEIFENDICISTKQDLSVLTNVLFEPHTSLADSMTYDITAWSIPYVFGLKSYATEKELGLKQFSPRKTKSREYNFGFEPYGYLVSWGSINELKFLAELFKNKVTVRVAEKSFTHQGLMYDPGTLFISPRGNNHLGPKLHKIIIEATKLHQPDLVTTQTGKSSKGIDLGSSNFRVIKAPRIAVMAGDGISSNNFGEVWHFFEQQIDYPISVFKSLDFKSIPFQDLDVLILPGGSYGFLKTELAPSAQIKKETSASSLLKKSPPPELLDWVNKGGRLIIMGSAMEKFVDQKGYGLVKYESDAAKKEGKKIADKEKLDARDKKYGKRKRDKLIDTMYGDIIRIDLDNSHPLAFGYNDQYFGLKLEKKLYPLLPKGWNVGILKNSESHVAGFMGYRIKKKINNNMVLGVHDAKKGKIIYMADNPLFRSFWYNSKVLFGNAVFIVGK